jgi:hypothetical protein
MIGKMISRCRILEKSVEGRMGVCQAVAQHNVVFIHRIRKGFFLHATKRW